MPLLEFLWTSIGQPCVARNCGPLRPKFSARSKWGSRANEMIKMPNRTKTAAWPIFAAFLASVFSTAIACAAARAADDCLREPKNQTPPGGHWYYRIDGPNHRKCWFLGDEGQKGQPGWIAATVFSTASPATDGSSNPTICCGCPRRTAEGDDTHGTAAVVWPH